jgi:hypothetical protein
MEVVKEADDASGSKMSEVVVRVDMALVKGQHSSVKETVRRSLNRTRG